MPLSREECFRRFPRLLEEYKKTISVSPPEVLSLPFLRRNPIVLMHDMSKVVPEGEQYDPFVERLYCLAEMTYDISLDDMLLSWWRPASQSVLPGIFKGVMTEEWAERVLAIWTDIDYTKQTLE